MSASRSEATPIRKRALGAGASKLKLSLSAAVSDEGAVGFHTSLFRAYLKPSCFAYILNEMYENLGTLS